MEDTLDTAIEELNERNGLQRIVPIYEQALKDAYCLFGDQAFRKVSNEQSRRSPVNKLLMLAICVLLARHEAEYRKGIDTSKGLTQQFANLMDEDVDLFNALTWSTNSKWNVDYTFKTLKKELFDKYLLTNENE